jgi:hypothetical protein
MEEQILLVRGHQVKVMLGEQVEQVLEPQTQAEAAAVLALLEQMEVILMV